MEIMECRILNYFSAGVAWPRGQHEYDRSGLRVYFGVTRTTHLQSVVGSSLKVTKWTRYDLAHQLIRTEPYERYISDSGRKNRDLDESDLTIGDQPYLIEASWRQRSKCMGQEGRLFWLRCSIWCWTEGTREVAGKSCSIIMPGPTCRSTQFDSECPIF